MEVAIKLLAALIVVVIAAYVLHEHWHERWGDNHH